MLEFIFKFYFIKLSVFKFIFGDIMYNLKVKESGICKDLVIDIVIKLN